MYIKVYSDAAEQPQTQQCSAGVLIIVNHKQYPVKRLLNATNNHEAEFQACELALKTLQQQLTKAEQHTAIVNYYTDSKIVADSIQKNYAKHYQEYVDCIQQLQQSFSIFFVNWIPDRDNQGAHQLALQALHRSERK
ncbi:ribonuclease HI family protein [Fructilactobacillus carniphilus]|uniref:Ribonuclease HI family protein n=1 Tax=Fructilactobacillus carniphilus TaxID=2940297 RepID=A0ABY5BX67_9LACO|nr:ribonuclease HI family protein [Fructilactobacillus carniphilus]USS91100.1 ribonuclease HI family protein [Fructilactobacillus carniphilus]